MLGIVGAFRIAVVPGAVLLLALAVTSGVGCSDGELFGDEDAKQVFSVYWDSPRDFLSVTHGGVVPLELFPPGMPSLSGTAVESTLLLTVTLRDENDRIVGIGAELESFSAPLETNEPFEVWWILMLPERGALYVHQFERFPQSLEDLFATAAESDRAWAGAFSATTTVGPRTDGRGEIIGGTGEFERAVGAVTESMIVREIRPDGSIDSRSRLAIQLM